MIGVPLESSRLLSTDFYKSHGDADTTRRPIVELFWRVEQRCEQLSDRGTLGKNETWVRHPKPELAGTPYSDPAESEIDEIEALLFVQSIYSLHRQGKKQKALDMIMAYFDDAMIERRIAQCDVTLSKIDARMIGSSMIITILGITGAAKAYLRERPDFIARALDALADERGRAYAERLLAKYR
ncbi:MAG: hypothetical protein ACLQU5_08835 [Isosphaeraceae bacterium]